MRVGDRSVGPCAVASGAALLVLVFCSNIGSALAVRGLANLQAPLRSSPEALHDDQSALLRLRGGWCRTMTRQRAYHIPKPKEVLKRNEAATTSRRPCSGPHKLSGVERFHGADVVRAALWGASPRSPFHDPATSARRLGFRLSRLDTNKLYKDSQPSDVNIALLKVCARGLSSYIPPLIEAGADIDYLAKRHTGAPMELVGLTPLSAASHQGHMHTIKTLLAMGASAVWADGEDREAMEGAEPPSKTKIRKYEALWLDIGRKVAAKRRAVKAAEHTKSIPFTGNNRRTPGRRKTRHAKGARGANH